MSRLKTVATCIFQNGCSKTCLPTNTSLEFRPVSTLSCNVTLSTPIMFPLLESGLTSVTYLPNRRWWKWHTLSRLVCGFLLGLLEYLNLWNPFCKSNHHAEENPGWWRSTDSVAINSSITAASSLTMQVSPLEHSAQLLLQKLTSGCNCLNSPR